MKKTILLLAICLLALSGTAAAELFVKKNKGNALPVVPPAATQKQQAAPAQLPQAPETMDVFVQRYYQNCQKKQHPILKGEQLRMLCSCSSQKLKETMTIDQVQAMATDTPEGQEARNFMAVNVYGPCMQYPARALLVNNCKQNKQVLSQHKNAAQICTCMADGMARYIAANGQTVLAQRLTENPSDPDPMSSFMASDEFQAQAQQSFMGCAGQSGLIPGQ